ncbi:MAG: hypothetical protein JWO53_869 [Chlamydiia bacterium]|nr:hypothetical protein [Chlamydiia bacterium]
MKMYKALFVLVCTALSVVSCTFIKTSHEKLIAKRLEVDESPVIIVGAGMTGLITAYELKKAGISSVILEQSQRIGGRTETITYPDKATAEEYVEKYFEKSSVYPLFRELRLPLVEDFAHSAVKIDGKFYTYTGNGDRDAYLSGIFTPDEKAAFLKWNMKTWELYKELQATYYQGKPLSQRLKNLMIISFSQYVSHNNLSRKVREWIRLTIEPELAIEWDKISALDGIDVMHVFLDTPQGFGEKNFHVKGGNSNFSKALAKKLPKETIKLNCQVKQIVQSSENVEVKYVGANQKEHVIKGKYVVVTVPLYVIDRIKFVPKLDDEKRKAILTAGYGCYAKVHYRVKPEAKKTWAKYETENLFTFITNGPTGVIYNTTDCEEQLSSQDNQVMTLVISGYYARELMNKAPRDVEKITTRNMDALFPGFSKYVTSTEIRLYPTAIAYWPLKYRRSRFDTLANHLREPFGRVYIGGDTTENGHVDGAGRAAFRISQQLIQLLQAK